MCELRELHALYLALEANPEDRLIRLALADWYDDHDQFAAAACLRWLIAAGRTPYRYFRDAPLRYHHETWADGWYWWTTEKEPEAWGYPEACILPFPLWERLLHTFDYDPTTFKEFATLRRCYEAVIAAWAALPESGRPGESA
jgi:uncharacterized protein (TIGR02996 family)